MVSIDTQLWMPLVHLIQNILLCKNKMMGRLGLGGIKSF